MPIAGCTLDKEEKVKKRTGTEERKFRTIAIRLFPNYITQKVETYWHICNQCAPFCILMDGSMKPNTPKREVE